MRARAKSEVPYTQRRLLGLPEFADYISLGKNRSIELAYISESVVKVGKRTLVDRVAFDKWVRAQKQAIEAVG